MNNLSVCVECDDITRDISSAFDYEFSGVSSFSVPQFKAPVEQFNIGLIVGPSGSGKSSILKALGEIPDISWNESKAVCSHFLTSGEAREKLGAVGLNSIPVITRPFHVLSNGEKFRADLARRLNDGALIDEFTSVVDRNVAKSCAFAVQRYIRSKDVKNIIFATCHYDVIEWLMPDWIFDTSTGLMSAGRGSERPIIKLEMLPASSLGWTLFSNHHYLDGNINKSARCWIAEWEGVPVGFASVIAFPSGSIRNAWRGHRTVVLPEFQGLGIGVRLSDAAGEIVLAGGGRYFSKTANYRMGMYRNNSPLWRPTSKNMKARPDYTSDRVTKERNYKHKHINRVCYSHEYIGAGNGN